MTIKTLIYNKQTHIIKLSKIVHNSIPGPAILKLMIIRVNLQFLYRRPNQYKRKLSEYKENKNNALNFLNQYLGQFVKKHTPKVDTYEYSPAKQKQYTERMVVRHIETFRAVGRASDQINRDATGERYEPISEEERTKQNNIHFPQSKPIAEIQLTTSEDKVLKPATEDLQIKQVKDQIQSLQWFKAAGPSDFGPLHILYATRTLTETFVQWLTDAFNELKKREQPCTRHNIFKFEELLTFLKNLRERKNGIEVSVQAKQSYKYFINCLNDSQIPKLLITTGNMSGENQDYQVQNSKLLIC
ncbi:Hypothetical_protein [Hexamita inflata]|uniref:Hypothetical_protein n=1 Tax=Hexamita inflata TaxID=28002 RepID=A0AA86RAU0_9EUKA|nr:Hypothetical protein HINF_LOCUS61655 [Hexamita inflata]